jgi:hypothetical protein
MVQANSNRVAGVRSAEALMSDNDFKAYLYTSEVKPLDLIEKLGGGFITQSWFDVWRDEVDDSVLIQADLNVYSHNAPNPNRGSIIGVLKATQDKRNYPALSKSVIALGARLGGICDYVEKYKSESERANAYTFLFRWSNIVTADYAWSRDNHFDHLAALRLGTAGVPVKNIERFVMAGVDPEVALAMFHGSKE